MSMVGVTGGPAIWREGRTAGEAASLLTSALWRGQGVPRSDGQPVLLIPGFMAGDNSLALMTQWLRRMGYRAHSSGITSNVECSEKSVQRLEDRVRELSERYGREVAIIGHSRGGMFGRVIGVRNPDRVNHVITLGSPLVATMDDFHAILRLQIRTLQRVQRLRGGRLIGAACEESWEAYRFGLDPIGCCTDFWTDLDDDVPESVALTSIYSRSDGVLHWRACIDPQARHVEVDSSHCGMAVNQKVYRTLGQLLPAQAAASVRAPRGSERSGRLAAVSA